MSDEKEHEEVTPIPTFDQTNGLSGIEEDEGDEKQSADEENAEVEANLGSAPIIFSSRGGV